MFAAAMGWIGTVGTIGAYVMLSRGLWSVTSIRYGVLNVAGGLLCAAASSAYGAWPSVASNLIWSGVAAHSVVLTLRARRITTAPAADPAFEPGERGEPEQWPDTLKMPAILTAA